MRDSLKPYALAKSRNALLWWQLPLSRRWVGGYVILLGVALGLRLLAMVAVPLIPEEAYYWMYAQHPALSYFDHPPMVSWAIEDSFNPCQRSPGARESPVMKTLPLLVLLAAAAFASGQLTCLVLEGASYRFLTT